MKKSRILLYHVLGWALYFAYDYVNILSIYKEHSDKMRLQLWLQSSYNLLNMGVFYLCLLVLYPRFLNKKKVLPLLVLVLFVGLLFTATRYLVEETLYPMWFGFRNYYEGTTLSYYISDNLFRSFPMMAVSAVVFSVQDAFKKENENKLLRAEKTQAELAFLKTQVNPHFLYNTLNYLYAQAYPISEKLAEAILKLSDMMRYMLHESPDGKVELQKEVGYLQSFIDIFRLRFEDRFFVDFTVEGEVDGQRVASLLLIPFVENAFKHGVADDPANPIQISLKMTQQNLSFEVINHIHKGQKDQTTGIGLQNIRRRLELLYPNQHELTVQNNGLVHQTRLKLQMGK
ncbi:MAG: sensor histidine kinase [Rufibacter sp.]